jgi:Fic family protein
VLAYLPVEAVIRDQQDAYYAALSTADRTAESTPFVEYMLQALSLALREAVESESVTDPVNDLVTDPVKRLLLTLENRALKTSELMGELGLRHKATFRSNYLKPALVAGFVKMSDPQSPNSPVQKYLLTETGRLKIGLAKR